MQAHALRLLATLSVVFELTTFSSIPLASAQSSQVAAEWALFNQILLIGIVVGLVVFGLLFYAIIRYRVKPQKVGA